MSNSTGGSTVASPVVDMRDDHYSGRPNKPGAEASIREATVAMVSGFSTVGHFWKAPAAGVLPQVLER